jgi:ferritin-like metal-binding protein YciE
MATNQTKKSATSAKAKAGAPAPKKSSATAPKSASQRKEAEDASLKELFVDELKDIYWAEKALTKALPKMAKAATSEELRDALTSHLEETQGHIERLDKVFQSIGEKAVAKKCEAMAGLTKEADELVASTAKGTMLRDVAIISAGQKVEHYEWATYGTLKTLAKVLDFSDAEELLSETLEEEKAADSKLTEIAEGFVNENAKDEGEDE